MQVEPNASKYPKGNFFWKAFKKNIKNSPNMGLQVWLMTSKHTEPDLQPINHVQHLGLATQLSTVHMSIEAGIHLK
jgi:hypothetical protein